MRDRSIQNAFFIGLLLITTAAFLGLLRNLFQPIFWAAVLATLFHPTYRSIQDWMRGPAWLSAATTLILIVLIVLVPLSLTGMAVAAEASALYTQVTAGALDLQWMLAEARRLFPSLMSLLERAGFDPAELQQNVSDSALTASRYLASQAVSFGQNTVRVVGLGFVMLYLLFFFLRDGTRILEAIITTVPIGDVRERRLLSKFAEVSRATIKGTIVIGLVQGGLGGIIFWLLGIEAAVLWGLVMGLLSLLPAVGSAVVWGPAALILMASGAYFKGIVLLVLGTVLIGLADNVLRPVLVGRDTQMPDFVILVSTLGGLTLFGLSGVVIGPVLAALFLATWQMFGEEYASAAHDDAVATEAEG